MRYADHSYEPCAFYRLSLRLSRWPAHSRRSALVPCFRRLRSFVCPCQCRNRQKSKNAADRERTKHSLRFGVCGQTVFPEFRCFPWDRHTTKKDGKTDRPMLQEVPRGAPTASHWNIMSGLLQISGTLPLFTCNDVGQPNLS